MKKIIVIIAVVLVIAIVGGMLVCNAMCKNAAEQWDNGNQAEAMKTFSAIRFYPAAASYVDKFEEELTEQLTECSWISESCMLKGEDGVSRYAYWEYTFHDDENVTRVDVSRASGGDDDIVQHSYDLTYSYFYKDGEVHIAVDSYDEGEYSVNFSTDENGRLSVKDFYGLMRYRDDFYVHYIRNISYAVDSPEND